MPSLVGLGFHQPPGQPKTLFFCLFVCLLCLSVRHAFERQRLCARFRHGGFGGRRYIVYSEADFEVFRPAGATRCTDGVKFGTEEGTYGPLLRAKFHPIGATTRV